MKKYKSYLKAILSAYLCSHLTMAMEQPELTNKEINIKEEIIRINLNLDKCNKEYEGLEQEELSLINSLKEGIGLTEKQRDLNQIQAKKNTLSEKIYALLEAKHYGEDYEENERYSDFLDDEPLDKFILTEEERKQQKQADRIKRRQQLYDSACSYLEARLSANHSILELLTSQRLEKQARGFYKRLISPLISKLKENNCSLLETQNFMNNSQKRIVDRIQYFYQTQKFKECHYSGGIEDHLKITPLLLEKIKNCIKHTDFSNSQCASFLNEGIKLFRKIYYYDNFEDYEDYSYPSFSFNLSSHLMEQHDEALKLTGYEQQERLEILLGTVHFANTFLNQISFFDMDDPYPHQLIASKQLLNIMHGIYITRGLNRQYPLFKETVFLNNNNLNPTIHEFYDFAQYMGTKLPTLTFRQIDSFLRTTRVMQYPIIQKKQHIYVHKSKPFTIRIKTTPPKLTIGFIQEPYDLSIQSHFFCLIRGTENRHYILNYDLVSYYDDNKRIFSPKICNRSFEILKFRVFKFFDTKNSPNKLTTHGALIPSNIEHKGGLLNQTSNNKIIETKKAKEDLGYAHLSYTHA